jgi:hypothetical protein
MLTEIILDYSRCHIMIGVIAVVVVAILLMETKDKFRRQRNERLKRVMNGLSIAIIVVVASTALYGIKIVDLTEEFEYLYIATVESGESGGGMILIPTSNYSKLQERTRIASGEGKISHVNTDHGRAIQLVFKRNVSIEGRMIRKDCVDDWGPSMLDSPSDRLSWIYLERGWNWNGSVNLELHIYNISGHNHANIYWIREQLVPGWRSYEVNFIQ